MVPFTFGGGGGDDGGELPTHLAAGAALNMVSILIVAATFDL